MNNNLKHELQNRREAALRLPPLEHLPGDVRDPAQINLKPTTFGLQQYRQWWKSLAGNRTMQECVERMVRAEGWAL